MISNGSTTTGFALNLIGLIHGLSACIISTIIFVIIIYQQHKGRMKRENRITLILYANIYLLIFIYSVTLISLNVCTVLGDLYGQNFDSSWCTIRGYFLFVMLCALYNSFVLQAFFRLCCIVYPSHRSFQLVWFYILAAPIHLVVGVVLLCPLLVWHDIVYLPNEYYCFISFRNIRATIWLAIINYGTPLFCLSTIYLFIIRFVRQQPNNQTVAMKRRQQRNLLVTQRIIILVGVLFGLEAPSLILGIILYITRVEYPLTYRIIWLCADVSMVVLDVLIVFMTPQLKNIVMKRWQQNRVMPMGHIIADSRQLRNIQ